MSIPDPSYWREKRVLLTGHTGFKGGWMALWLHAMGARVTGLALAPDTTPSLHDLAGIAGIAPKGYGDIRDAARVAAATDALRAAYHAEGYVFIRIEPFERAAEA